MVSARDPSSGRGAHAYRWYAEAERGIRTACRASAKRSALASVDAPCKGRKPGIGPLH